MQKTFVGGLISLGVTLYVISVAYARGKQMLQYDDPQNTSIEEGMVQEDVGIIQISTTAKPLFEIQAGGDNTVDLEAENYRRYMHIRLNNIVKTFEGDVMTKTNNYYELTKCREEFFQENDFYKTYWAQSARHQYCIDHLEDVYLEGNRDSVYNLKDSAYIVYEIHKCTEATRLDGYPPCAPSDEITTWLADKYATFKVLNQKIDFTDRDEFAVRLNEVFIPSVHLASGLFSDTGYRFRYNIFERYDNWWSSTVIVNIFYDYMFYNSDTFVVPESKTEIAEMYFRLEVDQMSHSRVVFSSMDFIGSLGGVSGFML